MSFSVHSCSLLNPKKNRALCHSDHTNGFIIGWSIGENQYQHSSFQRTSVMFCEGAMTISDIILSTFSISGNNAENFLLNCAGASGSLHSIRCHKISAVQYEGVLGCRLVISSVLKVCVHEYSWVPGFHSYKPKVSSPLYFFSERFTITGTLWFSYGTAFFIPIRARPPVRRI